MIVEEDLKKTVGGVKASGPAAAALVHIPTSFTAAELMASDEQFVDYVVPSLISTGLTVLTGKAKMGKSMAALNMGMAVAMGGRVFGAVDVAQAEVLYLALEDSKQRLRSRMSKMLHDFPAANSFHMAVLWPRMDKGFLGELERWLRMHPRTKLIIIDTFAKIRGFNRPGSSLYEKDYIEISALKAFADKHKLAIVLIHHLRKGDARDTLDLVSGSVGITAAADTILILTRDRGAEIANLYATGRDIEEKDLALRFNSSTLSWEITDDVVEEALSREKMEVIDLLKQSSEPLKLGQIAETLGKKKPVIHKHLANLVESGLVSQPAYGFYEAAGECDEGGENGESGESSEIAN